MWTRGEKWLQISDEAERCGSGMTATTGTSSKTWGVFDRALLVALVFAMIPGVPGVGIETRASGSDALLPVYTVAGLAPILALASSWKWPIAAGWIGVVAGVLWTALGALDLGGIFGAPPPPGMIVVDAVLAIVGVAAAWCSWRVTRGASA
jgi:hypothetical protein